MLRSRIYVPLVVVLVLAAIPGSAAAGTPDAQSLAVLARQSLVDEYVVLTGGNDRPLVASVDEFGVARTGVDRLAFVKAARHALEQAGLRYTRFDVDVIPVELKLTAGQVELVAEVATTLHFVNTVHAHDPRRDVSRSWVIHIFAFAGPTWMVASDTAQQMPRSSDRTGAQNGPSTTTRGASAPGSVPGSGGPKPATPAPAAAGYYDRVAAATYAFNNAYGHNPSYRNWHPNDCTNFVSQALRAGGWQYRQDVFWDWFYVSSGGESLSWVNAYSLKQFTPNSGRASFLAYFEDLQTGDVIFADWGADNSIDHAMIVDRVDCACLSGIYVSYHDNDWQRRSLDNLFLSAPLSSNRYYAYRITGTQ